MKVLVEKVTWKSAGKNEQLYLHIEPVGYQCQEPKLYDPMIERSQERNKCWRMDQIREVKSWNRDKTK